MEPFQLIRQVLGAWGLELGRLPEGIDLAGSPERTQMRLVADDTCGQRLVVEKIAEKDLPHKQIIAETLDCLRKNGMVQVQPYLKNQESGFIACIDHQYWQIVPFVPGSVLDRPAYVHDRWRGKALAGFILDLRHRSCVLSRTSLPAVFSITAYIRDMVYTMSRHRAGLSRELAPVLDWLNQDFMAVHDRLPIRFCHGDLHPLNVIWSEAGISSVIDWEFLGFKPEVYDIANLVGCLGMEDPRCLAGDMVLELIATLRVSGIISDAGWPILPQFMCAVRFAWLAEWLRKDDREMIDLEMTYMKLIMDNAGDLTRLWTQ
ncbi:MAG: aminoglycoside phosphotransferase family protein [Pseudomonadota bacterium]